MSTFFCDSHFLISHLLSNLHVCVFFTFLSLLISHVRNGSSCMWREMASNSCWQWQLVELLVIITNQLYVSQLFISDEYLVTNNPRREFVRRQGPSICPDSDWQYHCVIWVAKWDKQAIKIRSTESTHQSLIGDKCVEKGKTCLSGTFKGNGTRTEPSRLPSFKKPINRSDTQLWNRLHGSYFAPEHGAKRNRFVLGEISKVGVLFQKKRQNVTGLYTNTDEALIRKRQERKGTHLAVR